MYRRTNHSITTLVYTIYISVDLVFYDIFHALVVKVGIMPCIACMGSKVASREPLYLYLKFRILPYIRSLSV